MLALFHGNGSVYDSNGNIVLQGIIKLTFDGGVYYGWFASISVTETADKPYQFALSSTFTVHKEVVVWRSTLSSEDVQASSSPPPTGEIGFPPLDDGQRLA